MSLKRFHLVFITISVLLAFAVGGWCLWVDSVAGAPVYLTGAVLSFASALALTIYGVWFWKKMKRLQIFT